MTGVVGDTQATALMRSGLFGPATRAQGFRAGRWAGSYTAPVMPSDLLFDIETERPCFELAPLLPNSLGAMKKVVDEVSGFRYFNARDLLGFVDGTANPTGTARPASALVGNEDPDFAGGSSVVVQKYLHDLGMLLSDKVIQV